VRVAGIGSGVRLDQVQTGWIDASKNRCSLPQFGIANQYDIVLLRCGNHADLGPHP
jgi:hypothetical protein